MKSPKTFKLLKLFQSFGQLKTTTQATSIVKMSHLGNKNLPRSCSIVHFPVKLFLTSLICSQWSQCFQTCLEPCCKRWIFTSEKHPQNKPINLSFTRIVCKNIYCLLLFSSAFNLKVSWWSCATLIDEKFPVILFRTLYCNFFNLNFSREHSLKVFFVSLSIVMAYHHTKDEKSRCYFS